MVALVNSLGEDAPKVVDASTAHGVADDWGFPEMAPGQLAAVAKAKRVSNPGRYPNGAIALIRALVEAGLMPADYPVTVNAVSGYSAGGRTMIEAYEAGRAPAISGTKNSCRRIRSPHCGPVIKWRHRIWRGLTSPPPCCNRGIALSCSMGGDADGFEPRLTGSSMA